MTRKKQKTIGADAKSVFRVFTTVSVEYILRSYLNAMLSDIIFFKALEYFSMIFHREKKTAIEDFVLTLPIFFFLASEVMFNNKIGGRESE